MCSRVATDSTALLLSTDAQVGKHLHTCLRAELKDLAAESLGLLAAALPRQQAAFPALLSLPMYGALIGMFELNNLGGQCLTALPNVHLLGNSTTISACASSTTWVGAP